MSIGIVETSLSPTRSEISISDTSILKRSQVQESRILTICRAAFSTPGLYTSANSGKIKRSPRLGGS